MTRINKVKNEELLNSFNPPVRLHALKEISKTVAEPHPGTNNVNLHFHSFFSYNAEGWSPSRIAWESAKKGLYAAGIIDFDVLDGMEEFYEAGELLGLRTSVGLETRAFFDDYAMVEIDSPGEPGISYIAGAGFAKKMQPGSPQKNVLDKYRETAKQRNIKLIERINTQIPQISIIYENDVLPLTPSGNATERHIIEAYIIKSVEQYGYNQELYAFWSNILHKPKQEMAALFKNRPVLNNNIRARLAKKGGLGYQQPDRNSFPDVEDFFQWVDSCDAIPMESWLDGTSEGESDAEKLLQTSVQKGARALNLIPERNWNIQDPERKKQKVNNLRKIVQLANAMGLPLHVGTEMNKKGLPFVDDLSGPILREFKNDFIKGAQIITGHVVLTRFANFPYTAKNVDLEFNNNIHKKNAFFQKIGALPPVQKDMAQKLRDAGREKAFNMINDRLKKQSNKQ